MFLGPRSPKKWFLKNVGCTLYSVTVAGAESTSGIKMKYWILNKIRTEMRFFGVLFFYFVNLRFYVNCLLFYGIVQGHSTVKSQCRRQGSIPNRWNVIKVEVSVPMLRHRAQANFSEHTWTGKAMKLYILYIVIPK